jgi:hypothetical protein
MLGIGRAPPIARNQDLVSAAQRRRQLRTIARLDVQWINIAVAHGICELVEHDPSRRSGILI